MASMFNDYINNPAKTHTLDEFIAMQHSDEMTYRNFSIFEKYNGIEILDHNLISDYLDELENLCVSVPLSSEEYKKYRYSPDLLAFDLYGSVQLDFVILFVNGMIDPKEFDINIVKLPYASQLKAFLESVFNSNQGYIGQNRSEFNLQNTLYM